MSLANLTKEQKQYVVLGILGAAILLILLVIGIRFSLSSVTEAKTELDDLTQKITAADRTLANRSKVSEEFRRTMKNLKGQLENAPPERNYYSWATEVIYSTAREVGLEIDTIDEIAGGQSKVAPKSGVIRLESYALRITAHGGYNNVKVFIKNMREKYPLVRFTGVDINTGPSAEEHDVQLFMQWPFNLSEIAKNWEDVESKQKALGLREQDEQVDRLNEPKVALSKPKTTAQPVPVSGDRPEAKKTPVLSAEPAPSIPRSQESAVAKPLVGPVAPEKKKAVEPVAVAGLEPTPPPPRVASNPEPVVTPSPSMEAPVGSVGAEPVPASVDTPVEVVVAATDVHAESEEKVGEESPVAEIPAVEGATPTTVEPPAVQADPSGVNETEDNAESESLYVTTEKSARKLKSLLSDKNSNQSNGALGSLLDGLLENTDETQ